MTLSTVAFGPMPTTPTINTALRAVADGAHDLERIVRMSWQESRPVVQVMVSLRFVAAVCLAGGHAALVTGGVIGMYASWMAAYIATYVFNGMCDLNTDRINGKNRPLARGDLSVREAAVVCVALASASVIIAGHLGLRQLVCSIVLVMAGILYSWQPIAILRHRITPLACIYVGGMGTYVSACLAVGAVSAPVLLLGAVMSGWMMLVGGVLKDLTDIAGDRAAGRRTLAVLKGSSCAAAHGSRNAVLLTLVLAAGGVLTGSTHLLIVSAVLAVSSTVIVRDCVGVVRAGQTARRQPYQAFMRGQYGAHLCLLAMVA